MIGEPNREKKVTKKIEGRLAMCPIPMPFRGLCCVFLVFALPFQAQAENDTPQFYLGRERLPEVALSRPGCDDDSCPWWVYGNTYGTARDLAVGLVFRALSSGPISSRMHCFHAGCRGADSMFADSSDNFNETGDYYCAAGSHDGLSPSQICGSVAPTAHVLHLGNNFPFNAAEYLTGGFKTGGDRRVDASVRVHDIRFVYFGVPTTGPTPDPTAVPIKLLVVIYDPILESSGGERLHQALGWQDPDVLTTELIDDFAFVSHGVAKYQIVGRIVRDEWPLHLNGQRYTDELYLEETAAHNWTLGPGDWQAIIADNGIAGKVNSGRVDEVWLWGAPGFGWPESAMAGNGAYWINGGPISGVDSKAFVLMGFNYERGMAEALEAYGHRTESILRRIYGSWEAAETHDWNRFTLLDRDVAGRGGLGNAHNAFNAEPGTDYNRSSTRMASTSAEDWYYFPNMTGSRNDNNCEAWGCDGYGYLKWWYDHMPHVAGVKNGLLNNWWRYIVDADQYKANWEFLSPAEFDFAENNADEWDCWADSADCTLANSTERWKAGSSSVEFSTTGAFDTAVQYPKSATANWDLTGKTYFTFWAFAENANEPGFQNNSPIAYLFNSDGSFFKYEGSSDAMNYAIGNWKKFTVPLAGADGWTRTSSGTPTLADVDWIEIHNDTWGGGFTIFFDGVGFGSSTTQDELSPTVSFTRPKRRGRIPVISSKLPIEVAASDDSVVLRVDLYIDGRYRETDAIWPYIFLLRRGSVPNGLHRLRATAYDLFGNTATAKLTVYVRN